MSRTRLQRQPAILQQQGSLCACLSSSLRSRLYYHSTQAPSPEDAWHKCAIKVMRAGLATPWTRRQPSTDASREGSLPVECLHLRCLFVADCSFDSCDELSRDLVHPVISACMLLAIFQNFLHCLATSFKVAVHANISASNDFRHVRSSSVPG